MLRPNAVRVLRSERWNEVGAGALAVPPVPRQLVQLIHLAFDLVDTDMAQRRRASAALRQDMINAECIAYDAADPQPPTQTCFLARLHNESMSQRLETAESTGYTTCVSRDTRCHPRSSWGSRPSENGVHALVRAMHSSPRDHSAVNDGRTSRVCAVTLTDCEHRLCLPDIHLTTVSSSSPSPRLSPYILCPSATHCLISFHIHALCSGYHLLASPD